MSVSKSQHHASQQQPRTIWPRWLRRGILENIATALITAGVLMLLQPLSLTLYGYSFVTTLVGVAMFAIVTKFPE
jgi:hypothetical protein